MKSESACGTRRRSVSTTRITTVETPTTFWNRLLTCSPIIFLLLTMIIMDPRTMGSSMALSTCDQMVMAISGAFGSGQVDFRTSLNTAQALGVEHYMVRNCSQAALAQIPESVRCLEGLVR